MWNERFRMFERLLFQKRRVVKSNWWKISDSKNCWKILVCVSKKYDYIVTVIEESKIFLLWVLESWLGI